MVAHPHVLFISLAATLSAACATASSTHAPSACSTSIDSVIQVITPDSSLAVGELVGTVLDSAGDHPVEYAQVLVNPQIGTVAAHDGSFRLTGLPADSIRLLVRFIGYHRLVAVGLMPRSIGGRTVLYLRPNGCPIVG